MEAFFNRDSPAIALLPWTVPITKQMGCKKLLQIRCFLQYPHNSLKINPASQSIQMNFWVFFIILLNWNLQHNEKIKYLFKRGTFLEHGSLVWFLATCCMRKSFFTAMADTEKLGARGNTFHVAWVSLSQLKRLLIWEILWTLWGFLWIFQLYFKLEAKSDCNMLKNKKPV